MDWHQRFVQQANWTRDLRRHLYSRAGLAEASRAIEIGCGTGALLDEVSASTRAAVHGLDINQGWLTIGRDRLPELRFTVGDAHQLPYRTNCFDLTLCHFFLLWVAEPATVLNELVRITQPGGAVLALAEPDYGGRIDYPQRLAQLGELQCTSLQQQGADPLMGRQLASLFSRAGLHNIETGVLGGQWAGAPQRAERDQEWAVLKADLEGNIETDELDRLHQLDEAAWESGERVLYVPTFYAWGRVAP